MSLANDFYGGTYSVKDIDKVFNEFNRREKGTLKPSEAFYQKSMGEIGPTWR